MRSSVTIRAFGVTLLVAVFVISGVIAAVSNLESIASSVSQPSAKDVRAERTIAIVGDSLTNQGGKGTMQIETDLERAGFLSRNWYIYSVGGKRIVAPDRYSVSTLENIDDARGKLGKVNVWLIALGTNDKNTTVSQQAHAIKSVMKYIGTDKVLWVGASSYRQQFSQTAIVNSTIQAVLARYENATYLDWNAYIHSMGDHPEWWQPLSSYDPIHMTEEGYKMRSTFYVEQVSLAADQL